MHVNIQVCTFSAASMVANTFHFSLQLYRFSFFYLCVQCRQGIYAIPCVSRALGTTNKSREHTQNTKLFLRMGYSSLHQQPAAAASASWIVWSSALSARCNDCNAKTFRNCIAECQFEFEMFIYSYYHRCKTSVSCVVFSM